MDEQRGTDQGQGIAIISYIVAGLLFYGGLGWLVDQWLHSSLGLPIGLILGTIAAIYLVIKRYGQQ